MVHQLLTVDRSSRRRAAAGFTLVELTIVVVVVSIAGLFLAGVFRQAVEAYRYVDVEADLLQEARYAEERMTREIRRVRDAGSVTTATLQTFTFTDPAAATVSLSWNGTIGSDLLLSRNGVPHVLASGVDSLGFGYWKGDGAAAAPLVSPTATDIRRVTIHLRLARGSQKVSVVGAAALRSL
jgi:prepilin-type N-terminal cleavage/methylation domain-containing protein